MKVTIFGDSHVDILRHSAQILSPDHDPTFHMSHGLNWIAPRIDAENGGIRARAHEVENLPALDVFLRPEGRFYFSSILHTAPYTRTTDWRRLCPWSVQDNHPDLQPLSDAVLLTWVGRETAARLRILSELREKGFDVCVLEAPRPLERAPVMHAIRPDVMVRVDEICRTFIKARLAEIGVWVIGVPEETLIGGLTAR